MHAPSAPARRSATPRPLRSSGISEEGQGSWHGCSRGPSPPAVTLNPCQGVDVNTFPLSDLVVRCRGVGFDLRDFASQPVHTRDRLSR